MKKKQLKEFASLLNGYAFKSKNYVSSGIRIMRIANVKDGYICDEQPCYYPEDTHEEIEKYMLKAGDMLVSLTGNVGRIGVMPANMLPAALNQRVSCIRLKDDSVNKKYLFYFFQRKSFVQDCIKASKGVAQLNLSTKFLEEYSVPVPSLPEQERIVARIEELFSELDKAVETLKTTKQQLAVYRQAVLKEAFDIALKYTEKLMSIEEFLATDRKGMSTGPFGTMIKKHEHKQDGIPMLGIENIGEGKFVNGNKIFVTKEKAKELKSFVLKSGDIIISRSGTVGEICAVPAYMEGSLLSTNLMRVSLNPQIVLSEYFIYMFQSKGVVLDQVKELCKGSTRIFLNQTILKQIKFPIPSITKQKEIVSEIEARMSTCDSIEKTVNTALQQAEAMRQSILKQAFEGRLI